MGVMAIWSCVPGRLAEVARGGHLVVGERLRVEPRAEPTPERAVAAAVERVVADA